MKKHFGLMPGAKTAPVAILVILLCLFGTISAWAHAQLIKSNPADKAELKQSPTRVDLWFNELLDQNLNSIEVIPSSELSEKKHSNLAKGQPKVDPTDPTHLTVELTALKPGRYVIQYRVLSRDGHTAPGRIVFQVRENKN